MLNKLTLLPLGLLLGFAQAVQPSAPAPIPAPLRDLPWGQLNFLHSTDIHGWHAGHLQEPFYSADWGDYISFAQHLRDLADKKGVDLLLIDTGDRVEGNGLYDASKPRGKYTSEIFRHQALDVLCSGNHELYKKHTAENEYLVTVPNFRGRYLASNIDIIDPDSSDVVPLAPRFRKFATKNQGIRILAFGFLFDFAQNYNNTIVQPVETTVTEDWFQDAIRSPDVDLFLVIGHVAIRSVEYETIFKAIREVRWDTPIQFFGGHSHIRDYAKYDSKSWALESGRYMETIGFMSIEGLPTADKRTWSTASEPRFARRYIDNNLLSFYHHTGLNDTTFPTEVGKDVSNSISEARRALKLDQLKGCAPQDYWLNRASYPSKQSIFTWIEESVLPDIAHEYEKTTMPRTVIINTGALRFDIFKGRFTVDTTYIVSPFTTGFRYIKNVPYTPAKQLLALLNNPGPIHEQAPFGLQRSHLPPPEVSDKDSAFTRSLEKHGQQDQAPIRQATSMKPHLEPGYTTKDDAGEDGDDTLHSPITFYQVPNCIQAEVDFPQDKEPDTVDLIFLEFIEPWVLLALKFLGEEYEANDVLDFADRQSFTSMISTWIEKNWDKNC